MGCGVPEAIASLVVLTGIATVLPLSPDTRSSGDAVLDINGNTRTPGTAALDSAGFHTLLVVRPPGT
ncbi:MAG TPA: hypothetical protein VFJ16_27630 [Longimicrobium sp.]|nr:hypothetical protein [Longimicrobium sp.]